LFCFSDNKVRPEYVHEAHKLLKTSIIHVEVDDVVLDDDEEEEQDNGSGSHGGNDDDDDDNLGGGSGGGGGGSNDGEGLVSALEQLAQNGGNDASAVASAGESMDIHDDAKDEAAAAVTHRKQLTISNEKYQVSLRVLICKSFKNFFCFVIFNDILFCLCS
jgi:hypothetical protein